MNNIPVKFTRKYGVYNPGETAGFPPEKAKELIQRKVAESVSRPGYKTTEIKSGESKTTDVPNPAQNRMMSNQ